MDYLTVKEAAELKGCSERYVKKLCKDGAVQAEVRIHPQNKQPCYMIPVSAFPEPLQAKWYKQKRTEAGLLPEVTECESAESPSLSKVVFLVAFIVLVTVCLRAFVLE